MPEPPPVSGERARTVDRPPERCVRRGLHAHARVLCASGAVDPGDRGANREIDKTSQCTGSGHDEREAALEAIDHVEPRTPISELVYGRIASWGEDVVERERNLHLLASVELTCALVLHPGGGDNDRAVLFVVDVEAGGRIGDVNLEQHARFERHPLVLGNVREPLSDLVLQPYLGDPRLTIAGMTIRRGSHRLGVAAEVEFKVTVGHLVRLAQVYRIAPLQQERSVAEALQCPHIVGDEDDRPTLVSQIVEHVEALLLEGGVADREHLVDHQDVRIDLDRHGERQAHVHPRRVVLELEVLELLKLGEIDHAVNALARLPRGEAHHDPVHDDVVSSCHVRVEADAQFDHRRQSSTAPDVALGLVDARQAFQQRALAASVAAGDPEELSGLNRERDVVERPERVLADPMPRMESALLERMDPLLGNGERLADRTRDHHRQPLSADGWSWHGRESTRQTSG